MNQPNYMIVDGMLGNFVQDVSAYIDELSNTKGDEGLEKLSTDLMAQESEDSQEQVFKAIAERSGILSKAPEKDFEAAYNLVLHILTFSSKLTDILPIVLNNLSQYPPESTNGNLMVLSVLTNLFNILPPNSPLRHSVFVTILEFSQKTNNVHLLLGSGQLKQLPKWLEEWGIDSEAKKNIYLKVSEVMAPLDAEVSYKYLFDASLESENTELAAKLVKNALENDFTYSFEEIYGLSSVQNLASSQSDLYKLLNTVSTGDYAAYKSNGKSTAGVDHTAVERKVKVVAIAALASKATSQTISYNEICTKLDISLEEIELWIIDTIRAGLVEGRLCQMEQQFDIHRATPIGKFGIDEWKQVQQRLNEWKASLKEVLDVVKGARENALKEKQAKLKHQQVTA